MKSFCFFLLSALFSAGNAAGQSIDSIGIPMQVELREIEIRNPVAKWKQDSAANRLIYKKELDYATRRLKLRPTLKNGFLTFEDIFSIMSLRATGRQKQYRQLKSEMERNEKEDLSFFRYHPRIVMQVTGLDDSAARVFIKRNPMPREFLATATELDFMQWIRNRQKLGIANRSRGTFSE